MGELNSEELDGLDLVELGEQDGQDKLDGPNGPDNLNRQDGPDRLEELNGQDGLEELDGPDELDGVYGQDKLGGPDAGQAGLTGRAGQATRAESPLKRATAIEN